MSPAWILRASPQNGPAHVYFPPAAIPRPVVPSCVSTREFQTLGFQEFVRLSCGTRKPASPISMPCSAFLSGLKSVWEFPAREGCMEQNNLSPYRHNLCLYLDNNGYQENPTVCFRSWQTPKFRYEFSLPLFFQGYQ